MRFRVCALITAVVCGLTQPPLSYGTILNPYRPYKTICELALTIEIIGERLTKLSIIYDRISKHYEGDPLAGIIELYQSKELLPQNGIVHIVGPMGNFYEWVVPLLVRPDIRIIVSDKLHFVGSEISFAERQLDHDGMTRVQRATWNEIREYNSFLIQYSQMNSRAYAEAIRNRVWFTSDVRNEYFDPADRNTVHPFQFRTAVPLADLVFSRFPLPVDAESGNDIGIRWEDLMRKSKPGTGIIWTYTERHDLPNANGIVIRGDIASFLGVRGGPEPGRFRGLDFDPAGRKEGYLFEVPSE